MKFITQNRNDNHFIPLINNTTKDIIYTIKMVGNLDKFLIDGKEIEKLQDTISKEYTILIPSKIGYSIHDINETINNQYISIIGDVSDDDELLNSKYIKLVQKSNLNNIINLNIIKSSEFNPITNCTNIYIEDNEDIIGLDISDYYVIWSLENTLHIQISHDLDLQDTNVSLQVSVQAFYANNNYSTNILVGNTNNIFIINVNPTNNRLSREEILGDSSNYHFSEEDSFMLIRTNPKYTGNIKICVSSNYDLYLNTIPINDYLNNILYNNFKVSSKSIYYRDVKNFISTLDTNILFDNGEKDFHKISSKRTFDDQYFTVYNCGVQKNKNAKFSEEFSYFAPLYLNTKIPKYFVIFKSENLFDDTNFYDNLHIVKSWKLDKTTDIGNYIYSYIEDPAYIQTPLHVNWDDNAKFTWKGIDYKRGIFSEKSEYLNEFINDDPNIIEFEKRISEGYERNGLIFPSVLNLEFYFDDINSDNYTINNYFGLYCDDIELSKFNIDQTYINKINPENQFSTHLDKLKNKNSKNVFQTSNTGISIGVKDIISGKLPTSDLVKDQSRKFVLKGKSDSLYLINSIDKNIISNNEVSSINLSNKICDVTDFQGFKDPKVTLLTNNSIDSDISGVELLFDKEDFSDGDYLSIRNYFGYVWKVIIQSGLDSDYYKIESESNTTKLKIESSLLYHSVIGDNGYLIFKIHSASQKYTPGTILNVYYGNTLFKCKIILSYIDDEYTIITCIDNKDLIFNSGATLSSNYIIEYTEDIFRVIYIDNINKEQILRDLEISFNKFSNKPFKCIKYFNKLVFITTELNNKLNLLYNFSSINGISFNVNKLLNGTICIDENGYKFILGFGEIPFCGEGLGIKVQNNLTLEQIDNTLLVQGRANSYVLKNFTIEEQELYYLPNFKEYNNLENYNNWCIIYPQTNNNLLGKIDDVISLYDNYNCVCSILSFYPVKDFDFDFYSTEYGYTNSFEWENYYTNIQSGSELQLNEKYYLYFKSKEYLNNNDKFVLYWKDPNTDSWVSLGSPFTPYLLGYDENVVDSVKKEIDKILLNIQTIESKISKFSYSGSEQDMIDRDLLHSELIKEYDYLNIKNEELLKVIDPGLLKDSWTKYSIICDPYLINTYNSGLNYPLISNPDTAKFKIEIKVNPYILVNSICLDDSSLYNFGGEISIFNNSNIFDYELKLNQNFNRFLQYKLNNEYDYLEENINKDYCQLSRVNPWITKWNLMNNKDIYNNDYKLSISNAFGDYYLSSNYNLEESNYFGRTNQWYYIDDFPRNGNYDKLKDTRDHIFEKFNIENLYSISDDYFIKYFTTGCMIDKIDSDYIDSKKSQKFAFIKYDSILNKSYLFFKGSKFEVSNSKYGSEYYDDWKFSSIVTSKVVTTFDKKDPIKFTFVENKKFKTLTLCIEVYFQDYKIIDQSFGYFNLYTTNNGYKKGIFDKLDEDLDTIFIKTDEGYDSIIRSVSNIENSSGINILKVGDVKASSQYNPCFPNSGPFYDSKIESLYFINTDFNKSVPEQYSLDSGIKNISLRHYTQYKLDALDYNNLKYEYNKGSIKIYKSNLQDSGYLYNYNIREIKDKFINIKNDNGENKPGIYPKLYTNGSSSKIDFYLGAGKKSDWSDGITWFIDSNYNRNKIISDKTTFSYIKNNLENSIDIDWNIIDENGEIKSTKEIEFKFITPKKIIKSKKSFAINDNNKPVDYLNANKIGSALDSIDNNHILFLYDGNFIPKTNNIIEFSAKESLDFQNYYNTSLLGSNTKFSNIPAILNNYMYYKKSDSEILKLYNNNTKYSEINEISIDKRIFNVTKSSWNSEFFINYLDKKYAEFSPGTESMLEKKYFFGSKFIKLPKMIQISNYFISSSIDIINEIKTTQYPLLYEINDGFNIYVKRNNLIRGYFITYLYDLFSEYKVNYPNLFLKQSNEYVREYIEKNIIDLYTIDNIQLWEKTSIGSSIINKTLYELQNEQYTQQTNVDIKQLDYNIFNINKKILAGEPKEISLIFTLNRI